MSLYLLAIVWGLAMGYLSCELYYKLRQGAVLFRKVQSFHADNSTTITDSKQNPKTTITEKRWTKFDILSMPIDEQREFFAIWKHGRVDLLGIPVFKGQQVTCYEEPGPEGDYVVRWA